MEISTQQPLILLSTQDHHHQYGPHRLQRIITYVQQSALGSIPQEGYWVMYVDCIFVDSVVEQ
jgi:hypothetical protein